MLAVAFVLFCFVFNRTKRWEVRRQSKNKVVSGCKCFLVPADSRGEVLISSFLPPFTGGPGQNVSCELNKDI